MEKRFVFPFSFFDLKNENEKNESFSFILLNFLHVKCNCGIVHAPTRTEIDHRYLVSSTDQIYKCDRSMSLGKLLDNNVQLFIFISSIRVKLKAHVNKEISTVLVYHTLSKLIDVWHC